MSVNELRAIVEELNGGVQELGRDCAGDALRLKQALLRGILHLQSATHYARLVEREGTEELLDT